MTLNKGGAKRNFQLDHMELTTFWRLFCLVIEHKSLKNHNKQSGGQISFGVFSMKFSKEKPCSTKLQISPGKVCSNYVYLITVTASEIFPSLLFHQEN